MFPIFLLLLKAINLLKAAISSQKSWWDNVVCGVIVIIIMSCYTRQLAKWLNVLIFAFAFTLNSWGEKLTRQRYTLIRIVRSGIKAVTIVNLQWSWTESQSIGYNLSGKWPIRFHTISIPDRLSGVYVTAFFSPPSCSTCSVDWTQISH